MKLALVLYKGKWLLGEVERGLPPAAEEGDEIEPIVFRRPVEVLHFMTPVQGELGAVGFMTVPQLARLPLEESPFFVEYAEIVPPWRVMDLDDDHPDDELGQRYLEMMKPRGRSAIVTDGPSGGAPRRRRHEEAPSSATIIG